MTDYVNPCCGGTAIFTPAEIRHLIEAGRILRHAGISELEHEESGFASKLYRRGKWLQTMAHDWAPCCIHPEMHDDLDELCRCCESADVDDDDVMRSVLSRPGVIGVLSPGDPDPIGKCWCGLPQNGHYHG